ncbi:tyrosine-type recombinase/integrase [Arthrobacter sp. 2MCAF14]
MEATAYARGLDEVRRRIKASGPTEDAARKALVAKIDVHNADVVGSRLTRATTVAELGLIWLFSLRGLSAGSMESYGREVKRFITPELGGLPIEAVSPERLEAFLGNRPGAAGRVSRVVLRGMFELAVKAGALPRTPVPDSHLVSATPARRTITRVEYQRLLTQISVWQEEETAGGERSKDLHDQVILLLATGVGKVPEMLAASWEDFDLTGMIPVWTIMGTVERSTERGLHVRRYTPSEVSKIKLPGPAAHMLYRRSAALGTLRQGLVFPSRTGGPVDPANWRRTLTAAAGDDFQGLHLTALSGAPARV